jgi:hypothetical protein
MTIQELKHNIIHADGQPDYPKREPWQGMNFIR